MFLRKGTVLVSGRCGPLAGHKPEQPDGRHSQVVRRVGHEAAHKFGDGQLKHVGARAARVALASRSK